jgi:hypothetical protein
MLVGSVKTSYQHYFIFTLELEKGYIMALSQEDREWMIKIIKDILDSHVATCPYGKAMDKTKAFMLGFFLCIVAVSGGLGLGISNIVSLLGN